jgi:hypothetical protein
VLEGVEQRPAAMLTTVKRHLAELDELLTDMRPARAIPGERTEIMLTTSRVVAVALS